MMKPTYDYDLIVIGAGIAGMVSAVTANSLGKRVAVVEKSKVGGNCTNTTCIPSKALIHLGHMSRGIARLDRLGLLASPGGSLNRRTVMAHIRGVVQKAYEKDAPETFEAIGIDVIQASASFIDGHRIQSGGRTLSAETFIIAAGTSPFVPPIDGIGDIDFLTNESLYGLDSLPESLIILGGGVDGLEYASAFGSMGVRTTVVEMATRLLPQMDLELVNRLLRGLRSEGVEVLDGAKAVSLRKKGDRVVLAYERKSGVREEVQADRLLVTVGRKPALDALSLENARVQFNAKGIITDNTLRTTADHIYACGDIVGPYQLASSAEAQAIVAATNAVLPVKRRIDYSHNIYVVFTEPPLACIGLTEEQAYETFGERLKVYRFEYAGMRRALIDGNSTGVAKLLCDGRGRIVGAHILGEGAGEVIHEIQMIRAFRQPLRRLSVITHAYPTYAQALVGRASQLAFLDHMAGSLFVKTALRLLPGCANRLILARERLAEAVTSATSYAAETRSRTAPEPENAPCRITSSTDDQRTVTLDIGGSLDASCERTLLSAFDDGVERGQYLLLNFSGLVHMNPEGASLLFACAARAARKHRELSAIGLRQGLRNVFRLTGLDGVIALPGDGKESTNARSTSEKTGSSAG
ncbi:MAG: FAD-dependent oxidoreductase, partial [Thermodesulfobacteriota bacterium]